MFSPGKWFLFFLFPIIRNLREFEKFAKWLKLLICSGMLVQGPPKGNDVDAIFNQARQVGAVEGPMENLRPSSSSSFTGTGRTLASGEAVAGASQPSEGVVHNIVFWQNGFTVNDGPLRRLDDPENASFIEVIKSDSVASGNKK